MKLTIKQLKNVVNEAVVGMSWKTLNDKEEWAERWATQIVRDSSGDGVFDEPVNQEQETGAIDIFKDALIRALARVPQEFDGT